MYFRNMFKIYEVLLVDDKMSPILYFNDNSLYKEGMVKIETRIHYKDIIKRYPKEALKLIENNFNINEVRKNNILFFEKLDSWINNLDKAKENYKQLKTLIEIEDFHNHLNLIEFNYESINHSGFPTFSYYYNLINFDDIRLAQNITLRNGSKFYTDSSLNIATFETKIDGESYIGFSVDLINLVKDKIELVDLNYMIIAKLREFLIK